MSVMLGPLFVGVPYMISWIVLYDIGIQPPELYAFSIIPAIAGYLAYTYSPIPTHNGGFGMPPAKPQKWGFTWESQEGYRDPKPEDYGPILNGFSIAEKTNAESDMEENND